MPARVPPADPAVIDLEAAASDELSRDVACCPGQVTDRAMTPDEATDLAALFKALADPVRLRLVSIVASDAAGEVCACDLPERVDRSQSTVSHHLSLLVAAGILEREQRGRWAWFRVDDDVLAQVAAALVPAPADRVP